MMAGSPCSQTLGADAEYVRSSFVIILTCWLFVLSQQNTARLALGKCPYFSLALTLLRPQSVPSAFSSHRDARSVTHILFNLIKPDFIVCFIDIWENITRKNGCRSSTFWPNQISIWITKPIHRCSPYYTLHNQLIHVFSIVYISIAYSSRSRHRRSSFLTFAARCRCQSSKFRKTLLFSHQIV